LARRSRHAYTAGRDLRSNEERSHRPRLQLDGDQFRHHVTGIKRPLLIVANGGHYFLRPDELIYDTARMPDKTYAIEEGSIHPGTECTQCEKLHGLPPGYYGDTFARTIDFIAEWIAKRY
jgi:hypothetical protein